MVNFGELRICIFFICGLNSIGRRLIYFTVLTIKGQLIIRNHESICRIGVPFLLEITSNAHSPRLSWSIVLWMVTWPKLLSRFLMPSLILIPCCTKHFEADDSIKNIRELHSYLGKGRKRPSGNEAPDDLFFPLEKSLASVSLQNTVDDDFYAEIWTVIQNPIRSFAFGHIY